MRKKIEIWEYLWAERKDQLQQKSKDKCSYCLQPVPSTLSFTLLPKWVANLGIWDVSFQLKSFRHCPHPYRMRSKTGGTPDRGLIGDLALDTRGRTRPVIRQAPKNLMTLGISLSSAPGSLDSVSRAEPGICIFTKPLRRSDDWPSWRTTWVEQGSFKTRLCSQKEPKRNPCSNVYRLSGP